jgi:hypothetical protein
MILSINKIEENLKKYTLLPLQVMTDLLST